MAGRSPASPDSRAALAGVAQSSRALWLEQGKADHFVLTDQSGFRCTRGSSPMIVQRRPKLSSSDRMDRIRSVSLLTDTSAVRREGRAAEDLMSSTSEPPRGSLVPFAQAACAPGRREVAVPDKRGSVEDAGLAGLPFGYPSRRSTDRFGRGGKRRRPRGKGRDVVRELFGGLIRGRAPGHPHRGGALVPRPGRTRVGRARGVPAAERQGCRSTGGCALGLEDEFLALLPVCLTACARSRTSPRQQPRGHSPLA